MRSVLWVLCSFLMMSSSYSVEKLVVIGKGPAGCSAAIFGGQAHLQPSVVEGQECDGQLITVHLIENYPGFPEGVNGEELIEKMRAQAKRFGADFKNNYVVAAHLLTSPFQLVLNNGEILETHSVIIATGSSPRWLGVPGENALQGKGVSASALCDASLFAHKSVCVAGGGDAAMEQALLLTEYATQVTILHRGSQLNASSYLIERVATNPKIRVVLNAQTQEILGEEWVNGVVFQDQKTKQLTTLKCEGIFVAIGRKPNTELFLGQLEMDASGFIVTKGSCMSSIPGVFAAGDVLAHFNKKVVIAAASGCNAAVEATQYLNTHVPQ